MGRTAPDPGASVTLDGVQVPLGKGVHTNIDDTSLLYNEYPSSLISVCMIMVINLNIVINPIVFFSCPTSYNNNSKIIINMPNGTTLSFVIFFFLGKVCIIVCQARTLPFVFILNRLSC